MKKLTKILKKLLKNVKDPTNQPQNQKINSKLKYPFNSKLQIKSFQINGSQASNQQLGRNGHAFR